MAQCSTLQPSGTNQDCLVPLSEVKNLLICDKDVIFTWSEKNILANWTNKIKQDLTIYAVAGLGNYNVTTDDPNIVTQPVRKSKKITNKPVPSFEAFLDSNACDYKQLLNTLKGGTYGIFYELHDGSIMGTLDQSGSNIGSFKPLRAEVSAIDKGFQEIDSTDAFRVYVNHTNNKEFDNRFYLEPVWDVSELAEAMPVALNMVMTGAYSSGDQAVQIKVRCGNNYTGLLVADFDEDETQGNVDVPAVTAVTDNGGGAYDLTVQKGSTPANLATGDIVAVRVKVMSGSDVTHISNWIYVEGVT